jgi:F-type H+-transporting ATPase subunit b
MSDTSQDEAADTHAEETARDVSGAASSAVTTSGHSEAELHSEVGHADTGFTCAPGLPQMCTDTFASQIFWLVLTFVFLYVMMSRVTLPKIGRVIEERRDRIADDLGKAEDLRTQSQTAIEDYEQALADARAKAHVLAQETRDKLSAEADERKAAIEAELAVKLDAAASRIDDTKTAALASIREVASDTAGAVVERILGEAGNDDAIAAAVNTELQRRGDQETTS